MYSFFLLREPRSYQSKSKNKYQQEIKDFFNDNFKNHKTLDCELYGIIYYFFNSRKKKNIHDILDADNLSKPVWDALKGIAYVDDKQVKIRYAGVADKDKEINSFDLTRLSPRLSKKFLKLWESEKIIDFIYIEFGKLNDSLFIFNGEEINDYK